MGQAVEGRNLTMCDFCEDLRNIEPASYLGGGDEEFQSWIREMRKKKAFIWVRSADDGYELSAVEKCPVCGHVFTEEEYNELTL